MPDELYQKEHKFIILKYKKNDMIFIISYFLLLSRMKVIPIDKTFYPSTAIFQPKTLPALPVERQTYTLPILPDEAT